VGSGMGNCVLLVGTDRGVPIKTFSSDVSLIKAGQLFFEVSFRFSWEALYNTASLQLTICLIMA